MKSYIYCTTVEKGMHAFYLMIEDKKYYLFMQKYKRSNKDVFKRGVFLDEFNKLKKHCSYCVRHTIAKLPTYIRYLENEYGIKIMEATKRKQDDWKRRKKFEENNCSCFYDSYTLKCLN